MTTEVQPAGTDTQLLPVLVCGHPALRRRSKAVAAVTPDIRRLAEQLLATLRLHEPPGIGLAAPQVGVNLRIVALAVPAEDSNGPALSPGEQVLLPAMPLVVVNPVVAAVSEATSVAVEGCLSVPGLEGPVCRAVNIRLQAETTNGNAIDMECGGLLARCLQHEIDHLDGVLFFDHLDAEAYAVLAGRIRSMETREKKRLKRQRH